MIAIRRAAWFFSLVLMMACIMGVLGSIRGEAVAGVIASHGTDGMVARNMDMTKIQSFLEQKIVLQKLSDYGVSADEAMEKSPRDEQSGCASSRRSNRPGSRRDGLWTGHSDRAGGSRPPDRRDPQADE
jgi:hypothetical protein